MAIIGITGKKGSGKTTAAESIVIADKAYSIYNMSDPLKDAVCAIFGWPASYVKDPSLKDKIDPYWGISPRQVLQSLGTEFAQYYLPTLYPEFAKITGRELWVKRFKLYYESRDGIPGMEPINVVIPDVRFQHEVDCIRQLNGEIWQILRPDLESTDNHESETEMDNIVGDRVINNSGSLYWYMGYIKLVFEEAKTETDSAIAQVPLGEYEKERQIYIEENEMDGIRKDQKGFSNLDANMSTDLDNNTIVFSSGPMGPLAKDFADEIVSQIAPCRERSLALTKLEEAVMWANKGIMKR